MSNIGLAITTFIGHHNTHNRLNFFKRSINSLTETSARNQNIIIVDDGSITDEHLHFALKKLPNITIIKKKENSGVGFTKNTAIKTILNHGHHYGIVCDDDIIYQDGFLELYANAMLDINSHHLNFCVNQTANKREKVKGKLVETALLNGVLFTFSLDTIERVGYLANSPVKWGCEHVNFTQRVNTAFGISTYLDANNSDQYVECIPASLSQSSVNITPDLIKAASSLYDIKGYLPFKEY